MIDIMNDKRVEKDTLGTVLVNKKSYWGAQTQRSLENFPVCTLTPHPEYTESTVIIKKAAAKVNYDLKLLDSQRAKNIIKACNEIISGKLKDQIVVNPYQAGAGTSHNMNINEVIANRGNELLGYELGSYKIIHPNDHVNLSQSTNDVIPTAIRIASIKLIIPLISKLKKLENTFSQKAREFYKIIKSGRTHLQDALPVTLGQEFSTYRFSLTRDRKTIEKMQENLFFVGIGGTGVGTGINSHPRYHKLMILELSRLTHLSLKSSDNLMYTMNNASDFLNLSSSLRTLSATLIKIGNDLRLMYSGPGTGFYEILLPPVQPGSSIMPGKFNPSIVEMLTMICYQIIGLDTAIMLSHQSAQLELNIMTPLIAYDLLEQIKLLTRGVEIFDTKCLTGIKANRKMCQFWLERGTGLAAILNPVIGYDRTGELVKLSLKTGQKIQGLAIQKGYLRKDQADKLFSPENLTRPNLGT